MDTVNRFSSKAQNYIRYRWDYAPAAFVSLLEHARLSSSAGVADIGSGPGTIARHLVDQVAQLYIVEPNPEMRTLAEQLLGHHPHVNILKTYADATSISDNSVDLITVGRAIHWFTPETTAAEFRRILVPKGWLAIFSVSCADSDLLEATQWLKTETYGWEIIPSLDESYVKPFPIYFGNDTFVTLEFPHSTQETFPEFLGRLNSKSRSPDPKTPIYSDYEAEAHRVFDRFAQNGTLYLNLVTELTLGMID